MAEHTPPPWTFWSDTTGAWSIQSGESVICQRVDWNHRATESLANGRLFFSAPDLLAALKLALEALDVALPSHEGQHEHAQMKAAFDAVEAALNKAEP